MTEPSDGRATTRVDEQPRLFSVEYISDEFRSIHNLANMIGRPREERDDND